MITPNEIAARWLANDLGLTVGGSSDFATFIGRMPQNPERAIAVFGTQGITQGRIQATGQVVDFPGLQFLVRSNGYDVGSRKAYEVLAAIDSCRREVVSISGTDYMIHSLTRTSDVLPIGQDQDTKLDKFTINVTASIS